MDTTTLYSTVALAPVAAYALAPAAPTLAVVALVAFLWLHLQHALETARTGSARFLVAFILPLASLVLGTSVSLLLANPSAAATLSSTWDTFLAVLLYAVVTSLAPLLALAAGAAAFPSYGAQEGFTALLLPAVLFALAGIAQEGAGTGRVGWWVAPLVDHSGEGRITRIFGQVGADVLVAAAGVALAEIVRVSVKSAAVGGIVLGEGGVANDERSRTRRKLRRPLQLLALVLFVPLVGPLMPRSTYEPLHPAPDGRYVYPPLKVACVVPPSLLARPGRNGHGSSTFDDWIAETRIVAGRGAKVLSWSEGTVRLEKGAEDGEGGGADAMGAEERGLLDRVVEVCDMYKVYVLATYLVPPASTSAREGHKLLNVATLVGPRSLSSTPSAPSPDLVWSTSKHHPVPFIESYTHVTRSLPALGSTPYALPLADAQLAHAPHTPSPHRTPLQRVAVGGAICQDAAFPSLVSSYASPDDREGQRDAPRTPQLLLNPSRVPPSLPGLAHASLLQARARAAEHGAFVLRCAGGGGSGPSALIGPDGDGGALLLFAAVLALVRMLEGGELRRRCAGLEWLRRRCAGLEWARVKQRTREVVREARQRLASVFVRESEEGMSREGPLTEERLIDVD